MPTIANSLSIEPLHTEEFVEFIAYLNDHLQDNGSAQAGYFQPLPRGGTCFSPEHANAFRDSMRVQVGSEGWRRAWVARSSERRIVGHVDLRAHPERCAEHRCLLGMGVDRGHRRAGLGVALIAHARQWATGSAALAWIDLRVISDNLPALALYGRAGFVKAGETPDMFRIDGRSFGYASMSMRLDGPVSDRPCLR